MRIQIKQFIVSAVVPAIIATGCSGVKENKADSVGSRAQPVEAVADIRGQWYIENIVFSDSEYVRPDEAVPGSRQYFIFDDSTYCVMTNCNSISGSYVVNGDSIVLGDGCMTEMACDNMATEDALRRIIPRISTMDVQNDTVIRLNGSSPAECILLRKATTEIK